MVLRLQAVAGPDAGSTLRYEGYGTVIFGRAGTPDRDGRRPADPHLSREHLILEITRSGVSATAIPLRARFAVHGRQVPQASLADGDEFEVGGSRFRVRLDREACGDLDPAAVVPAVPRRALSDFDVGAEIGRGSWGIVAEGVDRSTGGPVAIKRLREDVADADVRRYFLREIDVAARLSHPHIVRTLAVARDGEPLFLAMERVHGEDLEHRVGRSGPLTPALAAEVGLGLLRALAHAHEAGIVHRDVKPANVLISDEAGRFEAKVADFGLARSFRDVGATSITATGEARGTLWFAAPEALRDAKRAGPAADLFGVGATIYYALTGRPWFGDAPGASVFDAILGGRMRPLAEVRSGVPAALVAVVEGALRADVHARPPSAAAMLAGLVAAGPTVDASPSSPPTSSR